MALTNPLDTATPAGGDDPTGGDDRIREFKKAFVERTGQDHYYPASGTVYDDDDTGLHSKVSLLEQADLGTGAVGKTLLGNQTVGGKGELFYTDEDDNDVQITDGGSLAAAIAAIQTIYPVGSIYITTVSTNPNTVLGFGTWAAFGAGKVLVGLDSGDGDFDTAEETGGAKTHAHDAGTYNVSGTTVVDPNFFSHTPGGGGAVSKQTHAHAFSANVAGASAAGATVQPYVVVYMFKRTA